MHVDNGTPSHRPSVSGRTAPGSSPLAGRSSPAAGPSPGGRSVAVGGSLSRANPVVPVPVAGVEDRWRADMSRAVGALEGLAHQILRRIDDLERRMN